MATPPHAPPRSLAFHPLWLVVHGAVLVGGIVAIAGLPTAPATSFTVGQPAPQTVISRSSRSFFDPVATRQERQRAAARVPVVYRRSLGNARKAKSSADRLIRSIVAELETSESLRHKNQLISRMLSAARVAAQGLRYLDAAQWGLVRGRVASLLTESYEVLTPFGKSGEGRALQALESALPHPNSAVGQYTKAIVGAFIAPTEVVNHRALARRIRAAEAKVKPVIVPIPAGSIVVRKGRLVTREAFLALKAVGIPSRSVTAGQQLAAGVFALTVIGLTLWYLRGFYPEITGNQLLMLLLDATILAAALVTRVLLPGHHPLLPYFFPIAGAAALTGLLVSSEVGVALAVTLALLAGWLATGSFQLTAYFLLTGVAGAMAVRQLRRLNDFLVIGAVVAGTAGLCIAAFHLFWSQPWTLVFLRDYGVAAGVNGLISGALAFGGFVLLGNSFGVTTSFHLLELGHPDRPLLRRLMADAPGTYNHSLVVASMVERAAQEINANVLLARVMALYHDVGKMANPLCFIENQIGTSNIHDDLTPQESAEIIRAHVTHGALLARQHRLPAPIRDGIMQHHGTMTMAYFFHKALEADTNADADTYSYPGPRPHSKEAALLMLADGCEGAVRALARKSPEAIRDTVNAIMDERVAAGQLSRCNLTLRDLALVRVALVDVLNGIYHPRIEYPASLPRPASREG